MPHITIEHYGLDASRHSVDTLFDGIIEAYSSSDIITPENVKMRTIHADAARAAGKDQPFVHITIAMTTGPSEAKRAELADKVFNAAATYLSDIRHVTLDIHEMNPVTYRKRIQ